MFKNLRSTNSVSRGLVKNSAWSALSFGTMAASGILINIVVERGMGTAALGFFNVALAIFSIGSHFTLWGIPFSTLNKASLAKSPSEIQSVLLSALSAVMIPATAICGTLFFFAEKLSKLFGGGDSASSLQFAAGALFLFSFNRTFLAVYNGSNRFKEFFLIQVVRYLLLLASGILFVRHYADYSSIGLILVPGEIVILLYFIVRHFSRPSQFQRPCREQMAEHLRFGSTAFLSGALIDFLGRLDLLVLSYFYTPQMVGVYALAAMPFDGMMQIPQFLRNLVNPEITRLFAQRNIASLNALVKKVYKIGIPVSVFLALFGVAIFPTFLKVFANQDLVGDSFVPFVILASGFAFLGPKVLFFHALLQSGHPALHTKILVFVAALSVMVHGALISQFKMYGASLAMVVSLTLWWIVLRAYTKRKTSIEI